MTIRTLCVIAVSFAVLCGACPPTRADVFFPIVALESRNVRLSAIEVEQVVLLACTRETDRIREFRGAYRLRDERRSLVRANVRCHEEGGPYGMPLVQHVGCTRTSGTWACGSRGPDYHKAQVGNVFALIDLHPMDRLSNELAADPEEAREVVATLLNTRRFKGQDVSRAINGSRCGIKPGDDVWYVRCETTDTVYERHAQTPSVRTSSFSRHDDHGNTYE